MTDADDTSAADYQQILSHIRDVVRASVPTGAIVLVISRGDEDLLKLDGRIGWHFPRSPDGRYAGYHPEDSSAALAHLDQWRTRGAQYLLLPATGFWWLDYYGDFAQNLRDGHGVVFEDDSCIIFRLGGEGLSAAGLEAADRVSMHLAEFVDLLLPPDAAVAVISSGDERLLRLGGRRTTHFPPADSKEGDDPLAALDQIRTHGVDYLVVPHIAPSWLDLHPDFVKKLRRRYACVAERRGVCSVFDLSEVSEHPSQQASNHADQEVAGQSKARDGAASRSGWLDALMQWLRGS